MVMKSFFNLSGIIRGIDSDQKMFYVITSIKTEDLQTVNCIVQGSATLPQQILIDQVIYLLTSFPERNLYLCNPIEDL